MKGRKMAKWIPLSGLALIIFIGFSGTVYAATEAPAPEGVSAEVPPGTASDNPEIVGREVVENLLLRTPTIYTHRNYNSGLHYAEVCSAIGSLRLAEGMGDKELTDRIVAHYDGLLDPEEGNRFITRESHVDHNVMGSLPLQIYLATGDERYRKLGLTFADLQWEDPMEDGLTSQTRWWIDDMYMVGMLQMQAFRATGEQKYADRAAIQIVAYNEKLQQPNGLYYHGPGHPFIWGRGNGWVAASMAELLSSMPEDHELRPKIMASYKTMMTALLKYQSENGMWRQLVDYEYSWAESSCTAMFAYAMTVGYKNGWLDHAEYGPAVEKAWKALCAHVDPMGNIREICIGTGWGDSLDYYLKRPRDLGDLHGQAPFLWLAAERLQLKQ